MRRKLLCISAFVAALVPFAAVAAAPPANAAELVKVCVTITPKSIGLTINGVPIGLGQPISAPRTCVGI